MIYEGKIKYLLSQALGVPDAAELMGYTEQAYNWCKDNEGTIWKAIIERKHLYTPDQLTTSQYFEDTKLDRLNSSYCSSERLVIATSAVVPIARICCI